MELDSLLDHIRIIGNPIEKKDGIWLQIAKENLSQAVTLLLENGARLITIVAKPIQNGAYQIIYHWDWNGKVLHINTETQNNDGVSIASICPAADWIEREIHDYYGIEFLNRQQLTPLILRESDQPGLFFWKNNLMEKEK